MEWKPVHGWPNYEVSEFGDVRKIAIGRTVAHEIMRLGYRRVTLIDGKIRKKVLVHVLVAEAFIGNRDGLTVDHVDCDKANNHFSNLNLVSFKENQRRAFAAGRHNRKGERHPAAKLTDADAADILQRIRQGGRVGIIAAEFGVSKHTVSRIGHGRAWRHIDQQQERRSA